jgi:hypothetical protein
MMSGFDFSPWLATLPLSYEAPTIATTATTSLPGEQVIASHEYIEQHHAQTEVSHLLLDWRAAVGHQDVRAGATLRNMPYRETIFPLRQGKSCRGCTTCS